MADTDRRFRLVNDYAVSRGFLAGFPNFHEADYGAGISYGVHLLNDAVAEWRDVPRAVYGVFEIEDVPGLFRAANDYASTQGYAGGFPNCHQADYGAGVVYGTILLRPGIVEFRDVPRVELGDPPIGDVGRMMRAANDWAVTHGYAAGLPTFHQADYGAGVVYGMHLFPPGAALWRDVLVDDLLFAQPKDERTCVILCRLRRDDGTLRTPPAQTDFYRSFFFGRGTGGLRDFYADITHGRANIVGDVIGWLDIGHTITEHAAQQFQAQRVQGYNWGLQAAAAAGLNPHDYPRRVVIIDEETDWGGTGDGMLLPHTAATAWSHSRAAHEFGHILGLDDAFRTIRGANLGRVDDRYLDIHCIMSYETRGSRFSSTVDGVQMQTGPGLNGVYTHKLGGIPTSRVVTMHPVPGAVTVQLAALGHAREEGAFLACIPPSPRRPDTYWVELHAKAKWDRGIPASRIAVHETRTGDGAAYAVESGGRQDWRAGDALLTPDGSVGIHVRSISGATAVVRIWELGPSRLQELRIRDVVKRGLGEERVVIRNDRATPASLAGWTLRDEATHTESPPWVFRFPSVTLAPGDDLTVWTRAGATSATDLFWGRAQSVWNDVSDAAVLADATGAVVSRYAW